jgi:hypothetical protein
VNSKLEGGLEGSCRGKIVVISWNCLKGLRKTIECVSLAGVPARLEPGHLPWLPLYGPVRRACVELGLLH